MCSKMGVINGCVVARSAEVKALGIPMGIPWFKIQKEAKQYGIVDEIVEEKTPEEKKKRRK